MTEFLYEYGLFLAKTVTWVAAALLIVAMVAAVLRQIREHVGDHLEIKSLNERFQGFGDVLQKAMYTSDEVRQREKRRHRKEKEEARARKRGRQPPRSRLFVLDFRGDLQASAVACLREEITAILQVAEAKDEVVLRLESEGGMVHGYGLAASQLARIRDRRIRLTAAIDKVAASGGYLMASVADQILAAPFAVVGSIGVIGQLPNFNRLLKKHEIDYELHTAGEFKRTLTLFGENTDQARAKFRAELEETHALFKNYVAQNRPQLPIDQVATGEHWFGTRALALRLIDALMTSDDYLLEKSRDKDIFEVRFKHHVPLSERLSGHFTGLLTRWREWRPRGPL